MVGAINHMVELGADASLVLIRAGHEMDEALRVPPKWEAICLGHWNGVSIA